MPVSTRKRFLDLATLAALLMTTEGLSACHFLHGEDSARTPVQVVGVRKGYVCGTTQSASRVTFFPDLKTVEAWQGANGYTLSGGEVSEELTPGRYILVEMGSRATGGYSFVVSRRASFNDGELQLTVTFLSPVPGRMTNQMVTSPCELLSVPSDAAPIDRVLVFDPSGSLVADSAVADAPKSVPPPVVGPSDPDIIEK